MKQFDRVCVIGMGYIGLPTAAIFARAGVQVLGVDVNRHVVESIGRGEPHIVEPDLDLLLKEVVSEGRLRVSLTPEAADAFVIAVPTPFDADHRPDISHVEAAAASIAPVLRAGNLVIIESTSPVGTTEAVATLLGKLRPDLAMPDTGGGTSHIHVAYCPERVLPGQILREVIENDRIVGGITRESAEAARDLYSVFVTGSVGLTTAHTAEMAKLAENAFRDVNIAFANELSMLCDGNGVDVWELISLANRHPRVNILRPGPGVGGHCIAVDPWFLISADPENSRLMRAAREVNSHKPHVVADKIMNAAKQIEAPTIACLGLAYKPDVDDLRESPAVEIVASLARDGVGRILAVEPHVTALPKALVDLGLQPVALDEALHQADIVVLLVAHRAFLRMTRDQLAGKVLIDSCGGWNA